MKRKLHIGGQQRVDVWKILNAVSAPYVDHICNTNNLLQFTNCTFYEIHATYIVERLVYKYELQPTLDEGWRVLEPGGKTYISVHDFYILVERLHLNVKFDIVERFSMMILDAHDDSMIIIILCAIKYFSRNPGQRRNTLTYNKLGLMVFFDGTCNMKCKDDSISLNMAGIKPATQYRIGTLIHQTLVATILAHAAAIKNTKNAAGKKRLSPISRAQA